MKKIIIHILILTLFSINLFSAEEKQNIVVSVFKCIDIDTNHGIRVSNNIQEHIIRSNKYNVLERQMLERALKEAKLSHSDLFDPDQRIKLGRYFSGKLIIVGTITKHDYDIEISAKLVSVTSSQIIGISNIRIDKAIFFDDAARVISYELINESDKVSDLKSKLEKQARTSREDGAQRSEPVITVKTDHFAGFSLLYGGSIIKHNELDDSVNARNFGASVHYYIIANDKRTKELYYGFTLGADFIDISAKNDGIDSFFFVLRPGFILQYYGLTFILDIGLGVSGSTITRYNSPLELKGNALFMEAGLSLGYMFRISSIQIGILGKFTLPFLRNLLVEKNTIRHELKAYTFNITAIFLFRI